MSNGGAERPKVKAVKREKNSNKKINKKSKSANSPLN